MTSSPDIRGPAHATRSAIPIGVEVDAGTDDDHKPISEEASAVDQKTVQIKPTHATTSNRQRSGSGFLPLLLGGAIAAALGFAVASFIFTPEADTELPARISGFESALDGLGDRLDALDATVADLATQIPQADTETPAMVEALSGRLDGAAGDIETLKASLDDLQAALTNLTISGSSGEEAPDFAAAFENQMSQFQARVDDAVAAAEAQAAIAIENAEAVRADAEAQAKAAQEAVATAEAQVRFRENLAEVQVALDTGAPFGTALAGLTGLDIPDALTAVAEGGVLPLAELQQTFPDAARAALQAADRGPDESATAVGKVTAFLMAQTNARSLEPREGNDADAILSRAEAALKVGNLEEALGEMANLPEGAALAIGSWLDSAETRNAAVLAVNDLNAAVDEM